MLLFSTFLPAFVSLEFSCFRGYADALRLQCAGSTGSFLGLAFLAQWSILSLLFVCPLTATHISFLRAEEHLGL